MFGQRYSASITVFPLYHPNETTRAADWSGGMAIGEKRGVPRDSSRISRGTPFARVQIPVQAGKSRCPLCLVGDSAERTVKGRASLSMVRDIGIRPDIAVAFPCSVSSRDYLQVSRKFASFLAFSIPATSTALIIARISVRMNFFTFLLCSMSALYNDKCV